MPPAPGEHARRLLQPGSAVDRRTHIASCRWNQHRYGRHRHSGSRTLRDDPFPAIGARVLSLRLPAAVTHHVSIEVANLVVAAALAGLIWTIQLVHYPLFALVGRPGVAAL